MKYRLTLVVLVCLATLSCRYTNKERLSPDTMKVVMWDMLKIDELYTRMMIKDTALGKSKENIRLYEEVFALHHITKKQFQNTYTFYKSHPIEFKVFLDSLEAFAERERNKPTFMKTK